MIHPAYIYKMAPNSRQRRGRTVNIKDERHHYTDRKEISHNTVLYLSLLLIAAGCIGIAHKAYLSSLFENDRHFSHLSTLERELAFRTEMGLYFSYFKTMITGDSVFRSLGNIMADNITEYPSTINTLKRFNLYPEVMLGLAYRFYQKVSGVIGHQTRTCWTVNRGEGLSPIQSCEGLGEPAYFYVEATFLLNGFMMGLFFLFGCYLSESLIGGVITVACFMFNHGECTRVMWTPPLRESFGYPFFVLQMFLVTYIIRNRHTSFKYSFILAAVQISFMLSWQFAQFALLTQTLAVVATYMLQFISSATFQIVLMGQTIGLLASFLLLFGNEMLLTSFFASCLIAAWGIVFFEKFYRSLHYLFLVMVSQGVTLIVLTLFFKYALGILFWLEDDAHIGDIFRSKFTSFQNFHTMLYTCAKEFDFIETETLWKLCATLLLPSTCFVMCAATYQLWRARQIGAGFTKHSSGRQDNWILAFFSRGPSRYDAELVYHTLQLLAFTAMAILVMRLKLFWTPHLCLYASLLASPRMFPLDRKVHMAVLAALLGVMAWTGLANIRHQVNIIGEFSNIQQEELVEWIKSNTRPDAVFAGAMPTMATVKLCTLRPIVNHPHYEDAGLRARTKLVYGLYSRKPIAEVKDNLASLGVQYAVLEESWCTRRTKPGCSMPEIWDIEDIENREKQPVCNKLKKNPGPHFKLVFKNDVYQVLELVKS